MSLGLAVSDGERIFVAIESQGPPCQDLKSKLWQIRKYPSLVLLATGGLDHWAEVKRSIELEEQAPIEVAVRKVVNCLNGCTTPKNQVFALLCGYENSIPKCFRINKFVGTPTASSVEEQFIKTVQPVGEPHHAVEAQRCAEIAINAGANYLRALRAAIEGQMPSDVLRDPVIDLELNVDP